MLAQLVIGAVGVITGEQFAVDGMHTPALISIGLVLAAIAGAWVLFVRSRAEWDAGRPRFSPW